VVWGTNRVTIKNFNPKTEHTACQYLHFAQAKDIWLKSILEWESGALLFAWRNFCGIKDQLLLKQLLENTYSL
jgi:hypothetical protein